MTGQDNDPDRLVEGISEDNPQDDEGEYGSDFASDEEAVLSTLLLQIPRDQGPISTRVDLDNPITDRDNLRREAGLPEDGTLGLARVPISTTPIVRSTATTATGYVAPRELQVAFDSSEGRTQNQEGGTARPGTNIPGKGRSEGDHGHEQNGEESKNTQSPDETSPLAREVRDLRSPLERFRTSRNKSLSVTDLISPSWCELQFWFSLTKHGKKRRTPAMRQGSQAHKKLEEQVHKTVTVEVRTKEDVFGLRIWNMIQGLQSLQETGLTREMEVWGMVDGQFVIGVIDELSYISPDPELESAMEASEREGMESAKKWKRKSKKASGALPPGQITLKDFFSKIPGNRGDMEVPKGSFGTLVSSGQSLSEALPKASSRGSKTAKATGSEESEETEEDEEASEQERSQDQKIYITDNKTRTTSKKPSSASFRPTEMQLMIYYHLLASMCSPDFKPQDVWDRFRVDPVKPFSDRFLVQMGMIDAASEADNEGSDTEMVDADAENNVNGSGGNSASPSDRNNLQSERQAMAKKHHQKDQALQDDSGHQSQTKTMPDDENEGATSAENTAAKPSDMNLRALMDLFLSTLRSTIAIPNLTAGSTSNPPEPTPSQNTASSRTSIPTLSRFLTANYIQLVPTSIPLPKTPDPTDPTVTTQADPNPNPQQPAQSQSNTEYPEQDSSSSSPSSPPQIPKFTHTSLGNTSILHSPSRLQLNLERAMSFWKGERKPQGVEVEEAWKCGSCEFADECEWRKGKVEEQIGRMRMRGVGGA